MISSFFSSTITRLLHHFSVSYLMSPHFSYMCAIDTATIKQSLAQLRSRQSQMQTTAPSASTAPSTYTHSSSMGGVTLEAIMSIPLGISRSRIPISNPQLATISSKHLAVELKAVVRDEHIRNSKSSDNVFPNEFFRIHVPNVG